MDFQNSENKENKDAVTTGVELMCRIFLGPDLDSCRHMKEGNYFQAFENIFTESGAESTILLDNIKSIVNKFDTQQSLFDHLNECYVRLFVNAKEGISAPLYESCYEFENAPMMGKSAVEMTQRFKSKGLSMENIVHEPPDHLAIELEYLFFVLQETEGFIPNEAVSFASETMMPWVSVFNQRLKSVTDECKFYFFASSLLVLFLELISNR